MTTHIKNLLQKDKNYSTTIKMMTTKNVRKWLTSSDRKATTTATIKNNIAENSGWNKWKNNTKRRN
jgi:hypothetical protein